MTPEIQKEIFIAMLIDEQDETIIDLLLSAAKEMLSPQNKHKKSSDSTATV